MEEAIGFLRDRLGLELRFGDGGRFAAFALPQTTLALLGEDERIVETASLALQVDDIEQTLASWTAAGAAVLRPVERGPHELRAVVSVPGGLQVVVSQKIRD